MKKHWCQKYISLHFEPHGCAEFVEMVLNESFGGSHEFPKPSKIPLKDIETIIKYVDNNLIKTDSPQDGDIVLMDGARLACHVGVYVSLASRDCVLHGEIKTSCSCLHRVKDLPLYGYKLNGYYKWK